ncbi:MAG TPA: hypothetical protein VHM19_21660 [Polyangiales bacterium]|nr:hypothetical protein [Polyangiales bacterium]
MLALVAALAPAVARADDPARVVATSSTTTYTFDDDMVGGTIKSSDLLVLQVRTRKANESLVRVREHFIPELLKSVEQL